jgi:hypothetical protein
MNNINHLNSHKHLLKTLKNSINSWDFSNPDWNKLPTDFPNCDTSGLITKQEGHLFDGIKLAWLASEGRNYLIKRTVRHTAIVTAIIFVLLTGKNIITQNSTNTNTVSAKTVSQTVGDFVEATMSAVFRK